LRIAQDSFFAQANGLPNVIVKRFGEMPGQEPLRNLLNAARFFYQPSVVVFYKTALRIRFSEATLVHITTGCLSNILNARHFPDMVGTEPSKRKLSMNNLSRRAELLKQ